MNITISGASGFVGRRLLKVLSGAGHELHVLSRHAGTNLPPRVRLSVWDPLTGPPPQESVRNAEVVMHLAGEPVAQRWTANAKAKIRDSRVTGTRHLVESLAALPDLYALGPLEGVRGEVSIFRSRPSIARVEHGAVITTDEWAVRACFLVWAQVPAWHVREVEAPIGDLESIAEAAVAIARKLGIDASRPFPFRVTGTARDATLHVLDKRDGLPHTAERHEHAKVRHRVADAAVELIAFYSRDHRGVFTPGDSDVHAHVRAADGRVSGHLERIRLDRGAKIGIPRANVIP